MLTKSDINAKNWYNILHTVFKRLRDAWLPGVSPEECWPPAPQGVEDEAVEDVAEAVRVEEVLGHPVEQTKVRTSAKIKLMKKVFQSYFQIRYATPYALRIRHAL